MSYFAMRRHAGVKQFVGLYNYVVFHARIMPVCGAIVTSRVISKRHKRGCQFFSRLKSTRNEHCYFNGDGSTVSKFDNVEYALSISNEILT